MAPKIDELINAAQKSVNESSEESKAVAEARLAALQEVKEAGVTLSQDEVNGLIKSEKEKAEKGAHDSWREVLDMDLDEAKGILEGMNDEELQTLLGGDGSEGDGESEDTMADRIKAALEERDNRINSLGESQHDFQRKYYDERIQNRIAQSLRSEGLQDAYLDPAKRLSGYGDLVDAAMNGEEPSEEKIGEVVSGIKEMSPVWFQSEGSSNDDGSRVVAGVRVRDGIPATPRANGSSELTEQQRAERANSPY